MATTTYNSYHLQWLSPTMAIIYNVYHLQAFPILKTCVHLCYVYNIIPILLVLASKRRLLPRPGHYQLSTYVDW